MHTVYEEVRRDAEQLSVAVTGSELVGLVPLTSILEAAEYYIKKENLMVLDEDQKVHLAINRLGLSTLSPFNPKSGKFMFPDMLSVFCQGESYRVLPGGSRL